VLATSRVARLVVTVRLPDVLSRYTEGREVVELDGSTVREVLDALVTAYSDTRIRLFDDDGRLRGHLHLFLRETEVLPDDLDTTTVRPSDEIDVLVAIAGGSDDVRMRGFRERSTVEEALVAALEGVEPLEPEAVPVTECAGRVLSSDVVSDVAVPPFRRATMDGYAVQADDTFGASDYDPVMLDITGQSMPGVGSDGVVGNGRALRIMTGAPVPDDADAVLRAEDADESDGRLAVKAAVAPGRNVGRIGEDIDPGTTVLARGRRLLPQDVGLLSSIGHDPVHVHRRPFVRIIVSGDELLEPGNKPGGSKIVDSNSPMLSALVERDGGLPEVIRLPDDAERMREALAAPGADVIVTAGAASVGTEDRVPLLVGELGELTVHGVAMRPSSPSGVGRVDGKPVLLLPGNPVSCLVAYDFFAGPVIRTMAGLSPAWPYRVVRLPLGTRIVSQIGRTDYGRVLVREGMVEPLAVSGASVLSSVTRATGFVIIPSGLEGYPAGTEVEVFLYDAGALP
jgi:molybdopterin molybdotransferase